MTTERDERFSSWLAIHLKEIGVTQREVAKWLRQIDVGAVNRRLNGKRPFQREELEIIDGMLGEHGALLEKAGYIPDDASPPRSKYLDEEWLMNRLKEEAVVYRYAQADVAEGCIQGLLSYLDSVHEQEHKLVRKYKTWLELDWLDLMIDRSGMDTYFLRKAERLGTVVRKVDNNDLTYYYESAMSDFSNGAHDYEQALVHERRALELADSLERPAVARLETEISIVHLLALCDPWNPDAEEKLETVKAALYVPSYIGKWPELDEPNYLEVLQIEFNLRLSQGENISKTGDTIHLILEKFLPAPSMEQNITSLLCVADFYATDGQKDLMESYLNQVQQLIEGEKLHWFDGEVERIREVLKEGKLLPPNVFYSRNGTGK